MGPRGTQEAAGSRCLRVPCLTGAASAPGRGAAASWLGRGAQQLGALLAATGELGGCRHSLRDPWLPHLGHEAVGLGERGRCQRACQPVEKKVPEGRVGPGRWRCFGGGALGAGRTGRAHLGHEAVGARVLLVLEDDVGIVIGGELLEALRAARDLAFIAPAGAQGLLGHVGAELLIGEWHELARRPPPAAHHPARPAAPRRRHQQQQQEQADPQSGPEPGGRHGREPGSAAGEGAWWADGWASRPGPCGGSGVGVAPGDSRWGRHGLRGVAQGRQDSGAGRGPGALAGGGELSPSAPRL